MVRSSGTIRRTRELLAAPISQSFPALGDGIVIPQRQSAGLGTRLNNNC
jgi:hypothetical protein